VIERVAHVAGNQHFVPRADAERAERQLERRAARGDGRRVLNAEARGQLALERGHFGALRELPRAHDARDALGIVVGDRGLRVGDHL